eukprot:CAMPEP_0194379050 /NCGR_PEP_ID=MMETSP0174-20130528/37731_1 /TAXON_ID=216777 /ORGANISM="Proboscia alata, Strain PI-D3" /LENGTH=196 /DNA_ID=CAMNT_0039161497 /DNA_START=102 /DNA_END=692 /DNA_ORIENTATION=+
MCHVALVLIILTIANDLRIHGFSSPIGKHVHMNLLRMDAALDPIDSERAKAMSEYLVKSHEQKLKSVKDVEKKRKNEIQFLKDEIESLKTSQIDTVVSPQLTTFSEDGSMQDLTTKLAAYQKFMADYIVRAQEQKLLSVKLAEVALTNKYEEKLLSLVNKTSSAAAKASKTPIESASSSMENLSQENTNNSAATNK